MAVAELLTLAHAVDGKVKYIDDTMRAVHAGARCLIFFPHKPNTATGRWKRNKINRTAHNKRIDSNYATFGEQRRRINEFVVP